MKKIAVRLTASVILVLGGATVAWPQATELQRLRLCARPEPDQWYSAAFRALGAGDYVYQEAMSLPKSTNGHIGLSRNA